MLYFRLSTRWCKGHTPRPIRAVGAQATSEWEQQDYTMHLQIRRFLITAAATRRLLHLMHNTKVRCPWSVIILTWANGRHLLVTYCESSVNADQMSYTHPSSKVAAILMRITSSSGFVLTGLNRINNSIHQTSWKLLGCVLFVGQRIFETTT